MGIAKKIQGAITFWIHPDERRTGILAAAVTWGSGMAMIGLVFLILVCIGKFPAPVPVLQAAGMFTLYIVKYVLYILSGAGAVLGVMAARGALAGRNKTTAAQLVLVTAMLCVLASAAMAIASIVRSAAAAASAGHSGGHITPAWVYVIEVVIIIIRLLFASILLLAVWTLREADRDPAIADMALTGWGAAPQLPISSSPYCYDNNNNNSSNAYSNQPMAFFTPPPAAAAAAPAVVAASYPSPLQQQQQQQQPMMPTKYPPQSALQQQQQQPVVWGAPVSHHSAVTVPAAAAAAAPQGRVDPVSAYRAYRQERRQQRGLVAKFIL